MDDFPASMIGQASGRRGADVQSVDSDREITIDWVSNPNQIVTFAPQKQFRLGYFDLICLVINFMIGTGVFQSHSRVIQGTNSTGASLLLWLVGIIYCLCGVHVYIEYGLNVPRYTINGVEQSVPRSGGDLNYLQYVYRKPAYRKNTVTLSTCIFGLGFIAFGNMAGNAISFAVRLLRACDIENPDNGAVRGIAIGVATLTCFIHTFSRRGGIWLNNIFAMVKISMLLLIVVIAMIVGAGGLPKTENAIADNTDSSKAFRAEDTDANGYAHAFLAVIFSFWGFEQPNYIMGEISNPKRKFPRAMVAGVSLICVLYMAVTISYMVVVPKDVQINGEGGVAQLFFEMTLGRLGPENTGRRIFNAFLAVSSIGNMVTMTYTFARVKQEIAKEGILPYAKFFAQNTDLSVGRVLKWLRRKGYLGSLLRRQWLLPEHHSEKTPIGAFVLHFLSCLILIFATWGMTPDGAYDVLTTLSVYVINCIFGFFIGLGILILRFKGPPPTDSVDEDGSPSAPQSWTQMTKGDINPIISVVAATIFTICNAWPVITLWVTPTTRMKESLPWWLIPSIAWAVIVLGVAWFLGFLTVAKSIARNHQKVFVVEKKPKFESAVPTGSGKGDEGLVLLHETTYLSWVGKETLSQESQHLEFGNHGTQPFILQGNDYAGTDFDAHFQEMQQSQFSSDYDVLHQPSHNGSSTFQQMSGQHQYPRYPEQPYLPQSSYRQQSQYSQSPRRGYAGGNDRY